MLTPAHVELYWKVKNNPYNRAGMRMDTALVFCDSIQHQLNRMDSRSRSILEMQAAGYTQNEIALLSQISRSTIVKVVADRKRIDFSGTKPNRMNPRRGISAPVMLGRDYPRRRRLLGRAVQLEAAI